MPPGSGSAIFFIALIVLGQLGFLSDRIAAGYRAEETPEQAARVIRALGATFEGIAAPFGGMIQSLDRDLMHAGRPHGGVSGRQYLAAAIMLGLLVGTAVGAFFGLMSLLQGNGAGSALTSALRWGLICVPGIIVYLVMDVGSMARRNSRTRSSASFPSSWTWPCWSSRPRHAQEGTGQVC